MMNLSPSSRSLIAGHGIIIAVSTLLACTNSESNEDPKAAALAEQKCRHDLQCWGGKNIHKALLCRTPIEKLTRFEFKWDDGTFESKFTHLRWHKEAAGTVTFIGDKLLVQNQFGAFQRMVYECDFDPIGDTPLAVRMRPGRLE